MTLVRTRFPVKSRNKLRVNINVLLKKVLFRLYRVYCDQQRHSVYVLALHIKIINVKS